ncbi:MAG: AAA family ATPase [Balneola sp.]|nr:AAA family ATPase [Balneola sp.]
MNNAENPMWSFLHTFCFEYPLGRWHGAIQEINTSNASSNEIIIPTKLATSLGLNEDDKVNLSISHYDAINTMQVEELSPKKSDKIPTLCEGLELNTQCTFHWEGKTFKVLSNDPIQGYFTSDTTVEDLTESEDGTASKVITFQKNQVPEKNRGFNKLVGVDCTIEEIKKKILYPIENPEIAQKYLGAPLKGAILYGPYGNGKTSLARAISEEANLNFVHLPVSDTSSMLFGPSIIKQVYDTASKNEEGTIVFIDEIDSVAPRGSEGSTLTSTLQECMDGFSNNNVFTLAATNHPNNIAEGLMRSGRFDLIIPVPLPDVSSREKLLRFYLSPVEHEPLMNLSSLASTTSSYTSSDIESVVKSAGLDALERASISDSTTLITQEDLEKNIQAFTPTGARILNVSKPDLCFRDLYGMEPFITSLKKNLDLISGKTPSRYSKIKGSKMLLSGPPGTGKTSMAKAIAHYLDASFVARSATSFKSKWVGETEASIRKLFTTARMYKPIVLFIDEIDALAKGRTSDNPHSADALNELLVQLEGFADNTDIYFIAATNRRNLLDSAFLSRMNYEFEMPLPNTLQRKQILIGLMDGLPTKGSLDYESLAKDTEGLSHRDLNGLVGLMRVKLDLGEIHKVTQRSICALLDGSRQTNGGL